MSALLIHAQAARILGESFEAKARRHSFAKPAETLLAMAEAYQDAARRMEAQAKKEAEEHARAAACTVDHATIKGPACPACKAPLGKR